jgi:hypothetical protein
MKVQISKRNMMAGEVTSLAIQQLLEERLTYRADYRMTEATFKIPFLLDDVDHTIVVTGWLEFNYHDGSKALPFACEVSIIRSDGDWYPSHVSLKTFHDARRKHVAVTWTLNRHIHTDCPSGFKKFRIGEIVS